MKRIFSFLSIIFLFFAAFLLTTKPANAISQCSSFTTTPAYTDWRSDTDIKSISNITIGLSGVSDGTSVVAKITSANGSAEIAEAPVSNSAISFNPNDRVNKINSVYLTGLGKHTIEVFQRPQGFFGSKTDICSFEYTVLPRFTCNINNTDTTGTDYKTSYGPAQTISIEGTFYNSDNNSERPPADWKIDVRVFDNKGNEYARQDIDTNDGNGNFKASIQTPNPITDDKVGVWYITASQDGKNLFTEQACTRGIYVSKTKGETPPASASTFLNTSSNTLGLPGATGTSFFGGSGNSKGPTPTDPCPANAQGVHICNTAIGDINASGAIGIITTLFKYLISVAGVGAIILLLVGGYRIILSRGDKEKLHEARDTVTSAILGLVFIILSLVILQIIGVSILQIPGFE
jgi:hypothetical protein